jgi:hypothetical protein
VYVPCPVAATQQALAGDSAAKLGRDIKIENFDLSHHGACRPAAE